VENLKEVLKNVKAIDWKKSSVSFFIVKRKLIKRKAQYEVLQVNVQKRLRKKIRRIITSKIEKSNDALEYSFNSTDLDDNLLGMPTAETDFQGIIDTLMDTEEVPFADKYEKLLNSWLYVGRLDIKDHPPLFSVRRVSDSWTTKKVFHSISVPVRHKLF